jgi:hypothetical protein
LRGSPVVTWQCVPEICLAGQPLDRGATGFAVFCPQPQELFFLYGNRYCPIIAVTSDNLCATLCLPNDTLFERFLLIAWRQSVEPLAGFNCSSLIPKQAHQNGNSNFPRARSIFHRELGQWYQSRRICISDPFQDTMVA